MGFLLPFIPVCGSLLLHCQKRCHAPYSVAKYCKRCFENLCMILCIHRDRLSYGKITAQSQRLKTTKVYLAHRTCLLQVVWGLCFSQGLAEGSSISSSKENGTQSTGLWTFCPDVTSLPAHIPSTANFSSVLLMSGRRTPNIWSAIVVTTTPPQVTGRRELAAMLSHS